MRRGLIIEAAEHLLAEHDPLLVTFEQVAEAAGVSRALVHAYLGDRRGLIDSVQVRIVSRLDTWVAHGLNRARTSSQALDALVGGTFAFVEYERDAWAVLMTSGGLDHPALHGVRARWVTRLADDEPNRVLRAQVVVASLLLGVSGWVNRGLGASDIQVHLARLLDDR